MIPDCVERGEKRLAAGQGVSRRVALGESEHSTSQPSKSAVEVSVACERRREAVSRTATPTNPHSKPGSAHLCNPVPAYPKGPECVE